MGCEPWRAWRVIGFSAAPARCAGHGVCNCVCVDVCDCLVALAVVRLKRISQKYAKISLKSILGVTSHLTSLKSVLSLTHFLFNRSRYCMWMSFFNGKEFYSFVLKIYLPWYVFCFFCTMMFGVGIFTSSGEGICPTQFQSLITEHVPCLASTTICLLITQCCIDTAQQPLRAQTREV